MSELNSALDFLHDNSFSEKEKIDQVTENIEKNVIEHNQPFNVQLFEEELFKQSYDKNKKHSERLTQNITGYDICHNCIQNVLYKLRNTPVPSYADVWLPVKLRTTLGNAAHEFLQKNTKQFTETELNLKVPSIGFYGKIDFSIGNNILGEIKSVPFNEYSTIVKTKKPREKDYLQLMTYSYIISNYLNEIKDPETYIPEYAGKKPMLDSYEPKKIQFLYIAHDIITSNETESFGEARKRIADFKRSLKSKSNPFFFLTSLVIDLDEKQKENVYGWIKEKFDAIHHYMETDSNPTEKDKFVTQDCFFCPYKEICSLKK